MLERLQRAGLLSELALREVIDLVGVAAQRRPDPALVRSLLRDYYETEGDYVEALWRRQSDRYVELDSREATPEQIVGALEHALPILAPLRAAQTPHALVLSCGREEVALSRVVRHARVASLTRRTPDRSMAAIVRGTNRLLLQLGREERFAPLGVLNGLGGFVACDDAGARCLARVGLTALPYAQLEDFLAFEAPRIRAVG